MIEDTERQRDEIVGYALGALDAAEGTRIEALVETDPEAARWLARYCGVAQLLPYALPQAAPRPEVRGALLEQSRHPVPRVPASPIGGRSRRLALGAVLRWAAVILVVAGLGLWNADLRRQVARLQRAADIGRLARQPDGPVVVLVGTGIPTASARLFVSADRYQGQLAVSGLEPLAPERVYQLWFARPGQAPVTGGTFQVSRQGEALVPVRIPAPLDEVRAIAITQEPAPASPRPTGPHLLDLRGQ